MSFDTISANKAFIGSVFTDVASFANLEYDSLLLKEDVVVEGNLNVNEDLFLSDVPIVQTGNGTNILGNTDVENLECTTLTVNGAQSLNDVVVNQSLTVNGTLIHAGEVASFGNVTAQNLDVFSSFDVTNLEIAGDLTIDGFLKVQNQVESTTLSTVSCDELEVTDTLTTSSLSVTNALTTNGPLTVAGIITQSSLPTGVQNSLLSTRVNGTLSCNQISSGDLSTSTVNVTGMLTATNASITNLNLTNLTTNSLTVSTSASIPSITSSVNLQGDLSVSGDSVFNGTSTFGDDVYIDNTSLLIFGTDAGILQTTGSSNSFRASTFLANVTVSDGEVQLSKDGIRFPDGSIQKTAAGKNLPLMTSLTSSTIVDLTSSFVNIMSYTFPVSSLARYFKTGVTTVLSNNVADFVGDVTMEFGVQTYIHAIYGLTTQVVTFYEPIYIAPNQSLTLTLRMRHSNATGNLKMLKYNVLIEQVGEIESINVG